MVNILRYVRNTGEGVMCDRLHNFDKIFGRGFLGKRENAHEGDINICVKRI